MIPVRSMIATVILCGLGAFALLADASTQPHEGSSVSGVLASGTSSATTSSPAPIESKILLDHEKARVRLVVTLTSAHANTERHGDAGPTLPVGARRSAYVGVDAYLHDRCFNMAMTGSGGFDTPIEVLAQNDATHLWWADFELLALTMRHATVAVTWSRYERAADGSPQRVKGDRRVLELELGEHHTLDFVEGTAWVEDAPNDCALNARVDVEVDIEEDPKLADARLVYDVWLVAQSAKGERMTHYTTAESAQGEREKLVLEPLRWPLPGARFEDGSAAEVIAAFDASVRGRARRDGTVAIDLTLDRGVGVTPAGGKRYGGTGNGGRKIVVVGDGEPVELVLPPTQGAHIMRWPLESSRGGAADDLFAKRASQPRDWNGVLARGGDVLVDMPRFFEDWRMSLIVKARRVE